MTKKKSPAVLLERTGLNSFIAKQRIVTLTVRIVPHAFKPENFNCPNCRELAQVKERLIILMVRLASRSRSEADVIPLHGRANVRVIN